MRKGLLLLLAASAAFSCAVEPMDIPPVPEAELTVLSAGFDPGDDETRTVRQADGKVFWSPADEISVLRGDAPGEKFVSDNTEPSAKALFHGRMPAGSGEFWAVHPYDPDARVDGDCLWTTVPGVQTAVAGSFDDDAFVSAVYTSSGSLLFSHVCGGFKFTLSEPGINRVMVESLYELDPLSGGVGIEIASGRPQIRHFGDWSNKVELVAPEGETLIPGVAYHIAMIPANLYDGFTMRFVKANGETAVRTVLNMAVVRASRFLSMKNPDKGLSWSKVFSFEPSSATVPAEGGVFTVDVTSSVGVHIDPMDDWIHEVSCEGDLVTGATYTFRVDQNPGAAREGALAICDDASCHMFFVSQDDGSLLRHITHHSLGLRFTATWCVHCPKMNESFRLARQALGERFEYVSLYSSSSGGNYGFADISPLTKQYRVSGYPSGIIDGRYSLKNSYTSEEAAGIIASVVEETEMRYPAVSAIGLASSLSGRELTVTADVYTQAADTYKLTVILMESGIVGYQADAVAGPHEDYHHDRVARLTLTPSVTGEEFSVSTVGETRSFTYTATVPEECDLDNLAILAWVQRPFGDRVRVTTASYGDYYMDNSRSAPVGTSAPLEVR